MRKKYNFTCKRKSIVTLMPYKQICDGLVFNKNIQTSKVFVAKLQNTDTASCYVQTTSQATTA